MIVAMDPTGIIGVNGGMPWHYKADFKRFKEMTMGGTLIMGRKTWESLPGPLPGRRSIVLTRASNYTAVGAEVYAGIDAAILAAGSDQHGPSNGVWICGGAEIYRLFLEQACADIEMVDVTIVPSVEITTDEQDVTRFPINLLEERFIGVGGYVNSADLRLTHKQYMRR